MKSLIKIAIAAFLLSISFFQPLSFAQSSAIENEYMREFDAIDSSFEQKINRNSQYISPISRKILLTRRSRTSFEMIANNEKPSELEREAILAYAKIYEEYLNQIINNHSRYRERFTDNASRELATGLARIDRTDGAATLNALARLYNGVITYGEFNKQKNEIASTSAESANRLTSYIRTKVSQERADRDLKWQQQQRDWESSVQQRRQQEQQEYERTRPQTTICNRIGDSIFCTSQRQ